jgi:hypothetical protein
MELTLTPRLSSTLPVGQDDQTAANATLKAVGARAPEEPRDFPLALQPFVLDGVEWPQFFDKNKRNNVVTFLYNPRRRPSRRKWPWLP